MLKKLFAYGAALIFLLSANTATADRDDNPNFPLSPVVQLVDKADRAFCTGFMITKDLVVTAGHCIKTVVPEEAVVFADGTKIAFRVAVLSSPFYGMKDYAILKLTKPSQTLPVTLGCSEVLRIGDEVRVKGYFIQNGLGYMETFGRVTAPTHTPFSSQSPWKFPLVHALAYSVGGNSGSPVFLEKTGNVIGILVGGPDAYTSLSTPISVVCQALDIK